MFMSDYLKAAAKTFAAAIVGFALSFGIEIPADSLEIVITALFVGGGSIILNLFMAWVQKFSMFSWVSKYLPGYVAD